MALSKEENDMLTQVGPGKPAGELLRRYWQPIGFANELQGKAKKKRILGEDVVLFKDEFGKYGVLALRCMHRGTSLEFGHIESGGIRVLLSWLVVRRRRQGVGDAWRRADQHVQGAGAPAVV